MTTNEDDDQPQGEVPAIDLSAWLSGTVQPDRATLEDRAVPRFPGGGYPVPPYIRRLLEDPPVVGEDEPDTGVYPFQEYFPPPGGHAYTLADVNQIRRDIDHQRTLDNARRRQPGYPHLEIVPDLQPFKLDPKAITCGMPRPRPTVFDHSRGTTILLAISLLSLVAIAIWIIIGAGR